MCEVVLTPFELCDGLVRRAAKVIFGEADLQGDRAELVVVEIRRIALANFEHPADVLGDLLLALFHPVLAATER